MLCWWVVTVMALAQGADYAGRWRRRRRGVHRGRRGGRSGRGAMREWPGDRPES